MTLTEAASIYISVNQKDERMFINSGKKHQYSYARLLMAKMSENELQFIGGDFKQDQILTIEANLQAGDYLILIEIDWMQDIYKDLILSIYKFFHLYLIIFRYLCKCSCQFRGKNS